MLIVDIGSHRDKESPLAYAEDEGNLVYVIVPTPSQASEFEAHARPNLCVFCLPLEKADFLSSAGDTVAPAMDLATLMAKNHIVDVDLLRISRQCLSLSILQGIGDRIHAIKKVRLELPVPDSDQDLCRAATAYLETAGFRVVSRQPDPTHPGEIVELIRVNRYARRQDESTVYIVDVPHLGPVETPQNDLVGRLLEQGLFEGPEQAFLWLYLRPGDTFFDCGAHVGVLSCVAAKKLQGKGRIVGFEPLDSNAVLYQNNLSRFGGDCFQVMQVGLSDQPGKAPFFLGKTGMSAYSTFAPGAQTHDQIGSEHILVEQVTLDQVVKDGAIDTVALAKLDVEGWEVPVLRGAAQSIAQGKFPLWMIEFTEENAVAAGSSTQELAQTIEGFGYTLCRFDATEFCLVPEVRRRRYGYDNLYAVLDLDRVNDRLQRAPAPDRAIAQDLVSRWDLATRAEEARHLAAAYQTLYNAYQLCEIDRADRLNQIETLTQWLHEAREDYRRSNADRIARLEQIQTLTRWLQGLQQSQGEEE